jgi:hypothetical protein
MSTRHFLSLLDFTSDEYTPERETAGHDFRKIFNSNPGFV